MNCCSIVENSVNLKIIKSEMYLSVKRSALREMVSINFSGGGIIHCRNVL